jgi:hypothetical protein
VIKHGGRIFTGRKGVKEFVSWMPELVPAEKKLPVSVAPCLIAFPL